MSTDLSSAALEVLREVFGYQAFRGPQAGIVEHVSAGGDALVLMPTGQNCCCALPPPKACATC